MKTYKYILIGFLIMLNSVLYVHQSVEIIKTGYDLENSKKSLSILIDENSNLIRDLSKLESPCNLLSTLGVQEIKFAGHRAHLSSMYALSRNYAEEAPEEGFMERVMDVFTVNAEARTAEAG